MSKPPTDPALETTRGPDAFDQLIPLPLMIALAMIVTDKFRDRVSEMALAWRNDPIEALLFD